MEGRLGRKEPIVVVDKGGGLLERELYGFPNIATDRNTRVRICYLAGEVSRCVKKPLKTQRTREM